jgi:hypothetical protein
MHPYVRGAPLLQRDYRMPQLKAACGWMGARRHAVARRPATAGPPPSVPAHAQAHNYEGVLLSAKVVPLARLKSS